MGNGYYQPPITNYQLPTTPVYGRVHAKSLIVVKTLGKPAPTTPYSLKKHAN
ncbi:MAG: hypothetical protein CLLPBCKN_000495 [Chroococcidiopsis cubana SAG 39.79]|jgi:hypothetical protein|uniref:hypothetical protein n=1 Tax=Chroococcidiopsis sp. CCNUC1 TaxID=2653189 RepID=UPI002020DD9C|nr:hypothetical protein [Chroococcidiopsis sp. CCNUC1]MDZ4871107.1 hypothetical protein [Chroococcidiopsis cubana SAG 39.79]URD48354.1 hypothetical protein M5J74_18655 [Chroococcidiopsis sp. CCNUC1]